MTSFSNSQQFSVAVKIFPFENRVVSVHILILRVEKHLIKQLEDGEDEPGQPGIEEETRGGVPSKSTTAAKKVASAKKQQADEPDKTQAGSSSSKLLQGGTGNIPLKKR